MFASWFAKNLPVTWDYQRIETTTGRGVPDAHICAGRGQEFWLEFKSDRSPFLRPEQFAWISRRCNRGGAVFILHRNDGLPWFLHDGRHLLTEQCSNGLKIISIPAHTGWTADFLHKAILSLL